MGSIFDDVTKTKIMDTAEVLKTEVLKKGKNSPIFLLEMLENRIKLNSANWSCLGTHKKSMLIVHCATSLYWAEGKGSGLLTPAAANLISFL